MSLLTWPINHQLTLNEVHLKAGWGWAEYPRNKIPTWSTGSGGPLRSKQELNPSRYSNANGNGSTLSEIYARKVLRFLALKNPGILKYSSKFLALKSLGFQGQFLPNISHLRHHRNSRRQRAGWGWRLILHRALGFLFQKFVHGITLAALPMGGTPGHGDTKWIPIQHPLFEVSMGEDYLRHPNYTFFSSCDDPTTSSEMKFVPRSNKSNKVYPSFQG